MLVLKSERGTVEGLCFFEKILLQGLSTAITIVSNYIQFGETAAEHWNPSITMNLIHGILLSPEATVIVQSCVASFRMAKL